MRREPRNRRPRPAPGSVGPGTFDAPPPPGAQSAPPEDYGYGSAIRHEFDCCAVTRTRRTPLGGSVLHTVWHDARCPAWAAR